MNKRGPSPYNCYTKDTTIRNEIREQHPEWSVSQIMSEIATRWKALSNDDRQKYVDQSNKEKISSINNITHTTITKAKRSRTPYMFYLYDPSIRDPVKLDNPEFKPSDITSFIAKQWNTLSLEARQPWIDKSLKERQELADNPIMVSVTKKKKGENDIISKRIDYLFTKIEDLSSQIAEIKSILAQKTTQTSEQVELSS